MTYSEREEIARIIEAGEDGTATIEPDPITAIMLLLAKLVEKVDEVACAVAHSRP